MCGLKEIYALRHHLRRLRKIKTGTKKLLKLSLQNGNFFSSIKQMFVSFILNFAEGIQRRFNFPDFKGNFVYKKNNLYFVLINS